MKLLNPEKMSHKKPPNSIMFEVSPAMTRLDVKNYLEKIYKVIYMWIDLFPITYRADRKSQVRQCLVFC